MSDLERRAVRLATGMWATPERLRGVLAGLLDTGRDTEAADVVAALESTATATRPLPGPEQVARTQDRLAALGARVLLVGRPGYPARLQDAWPELGAPLWLFARRRDAASDSDVVPEGPAVAVVGTRRPTADGLRTARELAALLAARGVVVVSGMARGIDQAAHRAALEAGGATVAVLGTGLDVDYPAGSRALQRAVESSGALVTEYPPATGPRPVHFLCRNARQLSQGVDTVPTMRAHIYTRQSADPTGQRAGVNRQEAECRALCDANGWTVAAVHSDNDVSAYTAKPRPGWLELADAVRAGLVDVLVGWHPDRFTRRPRELEDLIDLIETHTVQVATVTAGTYDLSTPSGRMTARVIGATANYESEHKAERQRAANARAAREGRMTARGKRAFGYTPDRSHVIDAEAALIREAADRALAGEPLAAIARDWNARGLVTSVGGPWRGGGLRTMLASAHLAGLREHLGVVVAKAVWEPILDEVTHRRLVRLFADPTRRPRTGARPYPLSGGLLVCKCGKRLAGGFRRGARRYVCHRDARNGGCGGLVIQADPLERYLLDVAVDVVVSRRWEQAVAGVGQDDRARLLKQIGEEEQSLTDLAGMWARRELSRVEWDAARRTHRDALSAAETALHRLDDVGAAAGLPTSQEELRECGGDPAGLRRIVSAVIVHAVIGRAVPGWNFFDPGRVDPVWRV